MTGGCYIVLQDACLVGHGMLPVCQPMACKVSRLPLPGTGAWLAICQSFGMLAVLAGIVISAVCYTATYFPVGKH